MLTNRNSAKKVPRKERDFFTSKTDGICDRTICGQADASDRKTRCVILSLSTGDRSAKTIIDETTGRPLTGV